MSETRTPIRGARLRGMLYIVGLGLADEKEITFRGLEIVKQCEQVFIEAYDKCRSVLFFTVDIRVKEPTLESLCSGRKQYEQPRYMSINTAIDQLLEVEDNRGESGKDPKIFISSSPSIEQLLEVEDN
ncbi:hypothetical protein Pyn_15848 [Prunus yedoensis var. nudiflora]|uniref:Uncharacterized protein n=1 Tax=Prunus yedoensis var. nudiflora TaxID=2094558 RepID=A0A314Z1R6_PRUYE|nr:hypothetical protein Pyn_15848 [Prunus yedoensis var. nudiflora]